MNIIIMILLISILVLVHEIGHFIAARLCGVRVSRFGIGMPVGPSWKMFRWQNTDFYLHAFLFGGYVMFPDDLSSLEEDKSKSDNKEEEEEIPENEKYESKRISQKLFIVTAGVLMNAVFAIILIMFCAAYWHKLPSSEQELYVENVVDVAYSNIKEAGIQKGDKILRINDTDIKSYYGLVFFKQNSKLFDDYAQEDLIEQNTDELKKLNPNIKDIVEKGQLIYLPDSKKEKQLKVNPNVLKGLEKYKKDGIKMNQMQIELRNDIYGLKQFAPNEDVSLNDIAIALSDTNKPLKITVLRNGKEITLDDIYLDPRGVLGVQLNIVEKYETIKNPTDVVVKSCVYAYDKTEMMLYALWQMVAGKINASDMHGVIAIVKIGGDVIEHQGMLKGLLLTAMISLNLAIMNLLPIPALDGGHVMFLIIEKITGKKPSKEASEKINTFFFMLLILLLILISFNDVYALITKKF